MNHEFKIIILIPIKFYKLVILDIDFLMIFNKMILIVGILFLMGRLPLSKEKLSMVVETFRHGAREPCYDLYNAETFNKW